MNTMGGHRQLCKIVSLLPPLHGFQRWNAVPLGLPMKHFHALSHPADPAVYIVSEITELTCRKDT